MASAQPCSEENYPNYYSIHSNNESISLSARACLEDYTLYLVDIERGRLTDKRAFKVDKISLPHNQGLYLFRNVLAVLSVQHQQIYIFHIQFTPQGAKFVEIKRIGRFCDDDDSHLINPAYNQFNQLLGPNAMYSLYQRTPAFREKSINSLKHRILAFLYRRAAEKKKADSKSRALIEFNQQFDRVLDLRMWKMQMLDENHILIKYTHEEVITLRISDINSLPTMFVIYNLKTTQIFDVFQNNDLRLFTAYENFCDDFRNTNSTHRVYEDFCNLSYWMKSKTNKSSLKAKLCSIDIYQPFDYTRFFMDHSFQYVSSPSNNVYSAAVQQKFKRSLINHSHRGEQEARKRILSEIPVPAQSFNCSPYLDFSLFSYDETCISQLERPKSCDNLPIRFYDQTSNRLSFCLFPGIQDDLVPCASKRLLAAFTFHPFDPFIISTQRYNQEFYVNFHLRHCNFSDSEHINKPFYKTSCENTND